MNSYWVFVLANVALLTIVGYGLNVLIGLTGQVSFGHVGIYAIGAYTVAILTLKVGLSFWLAWPVAALLGGISGALLALPALRVKGPYLAMITIAFGFIVEHSIVEMRSLTGGQNGLMGIAPPALGPLRGESAVAVLAAGTALVSMVAYGLLARGTWGAALRSVRDSETAAESIGLSPLVLKTVAFAFSAALTSAAGGLFAPLSGFVTPHTFNFLQSILFVLVVMIGGSGSLAGPLVGALIVGLLPEWLSSLEEYRLLFFGGLLLVVLWVAPQGVAGLFSRTDFIRAWASRASRVSPASWPLSPSAGSGADQSVPSTWSTGQRRGGALSVSGLSMQFGGVRAVSNLSFTARSGQVTSLIGPNGAGKTTALNMLGGFYRPTGGGFTLGDRALAGRGATQIARAGVARTYQTSQLFDSLSVQDNVVLAMHRGHLGPLFGSARRGSQAYQERARILLQFCGFQGDPATAAGGLAHVDRRFVEIARALASEPQALLLDEPAAGLSKEDKSALANLLRRIAASGVTVLLVEHDMELVMGVSDQVVVLDAGERLAMGTPASVQSDSAVRRAYLGDTLSEGRVNPLLQAHDQVCGLAPDRVGQGAGGPIGRAVRTELLGVGGLVAGYGSAPDAEPVLHGIDLQIRLGEVVALLGANGAGKSTLMRALAGLHRPVQGGIHIDGLDLAGLGAEAVVAQGVVLVPEGRQVFSELTVLDNLRLGAFLQPVDQSARVEEQLDRFPRLRERLTQRAGLLSGGEQQMLAIGRALMSRPRILLLDEPSLGLAPKVIAELFQILDRLRSEGMTILLVDQMASLALALADRAYVMEGGRIVAQGTAAEIAGNDALTKAYLGQS